MDHYVDSIAKNKDQNMLVKALIRMGFTRKQIYIYDNS